jgi:hypothetical protein
MVNAMKHVTGVWGLCASVFLCSCATTGYQRASLTRSAIHDTRAVTVQIQQDINAALQALQSLSAQETIDLRPPYGKLSVAVGSLDIQLDRLANRTRAIQRFSDAYARAWEKELGLYGDPSIRARSAERRRAMMTSLHALDQQLQAADRLLRPLLADLKDMRRFLSTDLTVAGVTASLDLAVHIAKQAAVAAENLQSLHAELGRVGTGLSPMRPETEPPTGTK